MSNAFVWYPISKYDGEYISVKAQGTLTFDYSIFQRYLIAYIILGNLYPLN